MNHRTGIPAPVVIVGAGQSGVAVAETLRRLGYDDRIVMIGDEAVAPYRRPPLSKDFLAGTASAAELALMPPPRLAKLGLVLMLGCPVVGVDRRARVVRFADGTVQSFGKLVIATGSRPRHLPVSLPRHGIHVLSRIDHASALRAELRPGARLVVIGGGTVGLEAAATAREFGLDITVVHRAQRLMAEAIATPVADRLLGLHRAHGVKFRLDTTVTAIEGVDHPQAVVLRDGERLAADVVLVAIGSLPNDDLARAAGLSTNDGILVDEQGTTSDPDIFATGDVTRFASWRYGLRVRLTNVRNAIEQAKVVAAALLGQPARHDPVPSFWSDQYNMKLQVAGLSLGHNEWRIVGSASDEGHAGAYRVETFADGRILSVQTLNDPAAHLAARRLLETEAPALASIEDIVA